MKRLLLFLFIIVHCSNAIAQCGSCSVTTFNIDLSGAIDTSYSLQSTRNGNCCTGSNCIRFNITLNPGSGYVSFSVANPAPNGSAYYQINCGPQTSIGTPACVFGQTNVCIVYCKPGNDNPTYKITTFSNFQGSKDLILREGCTGNMNVNGLSPATINWTSVYPGAIGAYNSFLSCTSGCVSTNVTPATGAPAYIDYMVTGTELCNGVARDTIRVYTAPQLSVVLSPPAATICNGSTTPITINADVTGGKPPYKYLWNTGETSDKIMVSAMGTYTVSVLDSTNCPAVTRSITVGAGPPPDPPVASNNAPLCTGDTLKLFASLIAGANYKWTGPAGFSSIMQNPVIPNATTTQAGNYFVTASLNGCTSATAETTAMINSKPPVPIVNSNSPVCSGDKVSITAQSSPGATCKWSGPNGYTSTDQNPNILNATTSMAGIYKVTSSIAGCTSDAFLTVVIKQKPIINAGPDKYVMENGQVKLDASGNVARYLWRPSVYLSNDTLLNPVCTPLANKRYILFATDLNGCNATDTVEVHVIKKIIVPNVFTPNGDGINDVWEIKNIRDYPDAHITIFNRYGEKVFESKGYSSPWDGKFKGKDIPAATYYYIIDPKSGSASQNGFVDIIR